MVDEEDRDSGVDDLPQTTSEFLRLGGVETGRRLVHADEFGTSGQSASRRHQLALTLADLVRVLVGQFADSEDLECEFDT